MTQPRPAHYQSILLASAILLTVSACATAPTISQTDVASILTKDQGAALLSLQTENIACPIADINLEGTLSAQMFQAKLVRQRGKTPAFQILPLVADTYKVTSITCTSHSEDSQFFYKETHTIARISDAYSDIVIANGEMTYPGTLLIIKVKGALARFGITNQTTNLKLAAIEQAPDLEPVFVETIIHADSNVTANIDRKRQHTLKPQPVQPKT